MLAESVALKGGVGWVGLVGWFGGGGPLHLDALLMTELRQGLLDA